MTEYRVVIEESPSMIFEGSSPRCEKQWVTDESVVDKYLAELREDCPHLFRYARKEQREV